MSGAQVRSVEVRLSANSVAYVSGMAAADGANRKVEQGLTRVTRSSAATDAALRKVGVAAKWAGLAAAGGMYAAVKTAGDFGDKMALVRTLSHANEVQMRRLSDAALNVGQKMGYSALEVADGEAEMIKAGVSLQDMLNGGLKGALDLAAAGQTSVASATEIAASAMTQFRLKGKDIPHVADLIAAGADKALGSVEDLGYGLEQAGTTAHQMGISIEDTTGVLAAFAQAGLIGERGGTTFKQMLLQLASPTDKARKLMKDLGVSLYDTSGQIKSMPELADNLSQAFGRMDPASRNAALGVIFGSRAIQGANIFMAEGRKGIGDWIRKVDDQGFAAEQASGKLDSLKGDLKKLKTEGIDDLITLGSGSQAPLRELAQNITGALREARKNGDLKKYAAEGTEALTTMAHAALNVAHGLAPVAAAVKGIVHGFNSLPKGLQTTLVSAALAGYVTKKTGLVDFGTALTGGGKKGAAGVVSGLASKGSPVPVFVTNPGFGGAGAGKGGGLGGVVAGEKAGKTAPLIKGGWAAGLASMLPFAASQDTYTPNDLGWKEISKTEAAHIKAAAAAKKQAEQERGLGILLLETAGLSKKQVKDLQAQGAAHEQAGRSANDQVHGLSGLGKAIRAGAHEAAGLTGGLHTLGKQKPKPRVTVKDDASGRIAAVSGRLHALDGQSATVSLIAKAIETGTGSAIAAVNKKFGFGTSADGSTVPKDGGSYADRYPYLLAPGEEVISNRHGQADRFRAMRAAGMLPGLASGGTAAPRQVTGSRGIPNQSITIDGLGVFTVTTLDVTRARYIAALAHQSAAEKRQDRLDELHAQQQIRDIEHSLREKNKKHHYVLQGLDRRTAQTELAQAKADYAALKKNAEGAAEAIAQVKEAQQELRDDQTSSLTGALDIFSGTGSPTSAINSVTKMTRDIASYGQILGQLKAAGATPMLLQQLVNRANSGDFASAVRLGKALLANPVTLNQLNTALQGYKTTVAQTAGLVSDPRFLHGTAWSGAAGVVSAPKVIQVQVTTDPTQVVTEVVRQVMHQVRPLLMQGIA